MCLLLRHGSDKTLQVGYANHFYRSAHKFEQICRHRLRRQNVGYSNFSQPQSHLSFCVLLQYLVERRRVVTQLGKRSEERFSRNAETDLVCRLLLEKKKKEIESGTCRPKNPCATSPRRSGNATEPRSHAGRAHYSIAFCSC